MQGPLASRVVDIGQNVSEIIASDVIALIMSGFKVVSKVLIDAEHRVIVVHY